MFSVRPNRTDPYIADVVVISNLDWERQKHYNLTIRTIDGGVLDDEQELSFTTYGVIAEVLDENDVECILSRAVLHGTQGV